MQTKPEKGTYLRLWDLHLRRCTICTAAPQRGGLAALCAMGRPLFQSALEEHWSTEDLLERRA